MTTPSGRVLTVGVGQQFSTLNSALGASQDGDLIAVQAGTYTNDISTVTHSVTIEGVGGLAHFQSTGEIANNKAILIDDAANLTVQNLEFSGAQVWDSNGAGIRYESGNLTVINSYFHDNQDGILGGAIPGGNVTITGSTFVHNGGGDGQTHGIYVGHINSLTVTNSFFQDQLGGSDIKSRAAYTDVENNRMLDTDHSSDNTNYQVDLPEGGNDTVAGNVMFKSTYPANRAFIHFGGEVANPIGNLLVENNQFYSGRDPSAVVMNQSTAQPIHLVNNAVLAETVSVMIDGDQTNTSVTGTTNLDIHHLPDTTLVLPTIGGSASVSQTIAPPITTVLPASGSAAVTTGGSIVSGRAAEVALIDTSYYLARNPDVKAAGGDAVQHFEQFGWQEGRAPDAFFDVSYYLSHNPDVAASGMDPLLHYATFGWKEGRDPSAAFSSTGYLSANADVKLAGVDPLQHYLMFGLAEGRAL